MDFYTLKICGLTRELPLLKVGRKTKIATFSILGDVELVDKVADEVAKRLNKYDFDYLVSPEVKVVPLTHGVALRLKQKRFVICRKSIKPYMMSPITVKPLSYFPKHAQPLVLDGSDAKILKGKRVIILDDIVSTGVTMRMMGYLMKKVGAEVVAHFAVIKQGEQFDKLLNLDYIVEMPVFTEV